MTTLTTTLRAVVLAALTLAGAALPGSAATVPAFDRTTNDGVFALTAAQIRYFGVAEATYVAFFRPRTKNNATSFAVGTIFDAQSLLASCRGACANILSVRNGRNADLAYVGGFLAPLATATVTKAGVGYYEGLAFFFKGTKAINFNGGSNFNAGQSRGDLDFAVPAQVPVPASLPLLAGALGMVALARRRRA